VIAIERDDVKQWLMGTAPQASELIGLSAVEAFEAGLVEP
jgi:hypothetical protein